MSRRRTSPFPDGWVDEGPSSAATKRKTYDSLPAVPVGYMTPIADIFVPRGVSTTESLERQRMFGKERIA